MSIDLATRFLPLTDELFSTESKTSLLTNQNFTFSGAATVKLYKLSTSQMHDYGRRGTTNGNWSRYGEVVDLDASTEEFTLRRDRSFTFAIDTLDADETLQQLAAASALARQLREVVVPETDSYTVAQMIAGAGNSVTAALSAENIYDAILDASNALDTAEAPEDGRVLVVHPNTLKLLKRSADVIMDSDVGNELRLKGVLSMIDGMTVLKMPAARLPENFGFMVCHPCACCAPEKLAAFKIHADPPGISGSLVEGRVVYDSFVLENKAAAIYVHLLPDPDTENPGEVSDEIPDGTPGEIPG